METTRRDRVRIGRKVHVASSGCYQNHHHKVNWWPWRDGDWDAHKGDDLALKEGAIAELNVMARIRNDIELIEWVKILATEAACAQMIDVCEEVD